MADNTLRPYGWRGSRISLDQRPVKDEVETSHDGTFASDAEVPDEDGPMVTAALEQKHRGKDEAEHHKGGGGRSARRPGRGKYTPMTAEEVEAGNERRRRSNYGYGHQNTPQSEYAGKPRAEDNKRERLKDLKPDSTGNRYPVDGKQSSNNPNEYSWHPGTSNPEVDFGGFDHADAGRITYPDNKPHVSDRGFTEAPGGDRHNSDYNPQRHGRPNEAEDPAGKNSWPDRRKSPMFKPEGLGRPSASRGPVASHPIFDRAKVDEDGANPSGARPGVPAEHIHVQRPSQGRKALDLALGVVRKFTAGAPAVAMEDEEDTTKVSAGPGAPNVFRDDSPYAGPKPAAPQQRQQGGFSLRRPAGAPQIGPGAGAPAKPGSFGFGQSNDFGQARVSPGGSRAGQPSGRMAPKRTMSYAEDEGNLDQLD